LGNKGIDVTRGQKEQSNSVNFGNKGIDVRDGQLEQFNLTKLGKYGIDVRSRHPEQFNSVKSVKDVKNRELNSLVIVELYSFLQIRHIYIE